MSSTQKRVRELEQQVGKFEEKKNSALESYLKIAGATPQKSASGIKIVRAGDTALARDDENAKTQQQGGEKYVSFYEFLKSRKNLHEYVSGALKELSSGKSEYADYLDYQNVDNLLSWLEENGPVVMQSIMNRVESSNIEISPKNEAYASYLLGVLVGSEYVARNYLKKGVEPDFPPLKEKKEPGPDIPGTEIRWVSVEKIQTDGLGKKPYANTELMLNGICKGIHEFGHTLRYINRMDKKPLTELALTFVHEKLMPPMHIGTAFWVGAGTRDFYHNYSQISGGKISRGNIVDMATKEYFSFLLSSWKWQIFPNGVDVLGLTSEGYELSVSEIFYKTKSAEKYDYCARNHITDKAVVEKFDSLFQKLIEAKWKADDYGDFFGKFVRMMDECGFGKPIKIGLPDYFVSNE